MKDDSEGDFSSQNIIHIHGERNIEYGINDVIVLCLVKNGEQYIKEFIEHYLKLGVKHIIFLDNGSTDACIKIAKNYENVTILQTKSSFAKGNNMRMRDFLVDKFAKNRWSLSVDIDEFFDYPFSDIISLKELILYLNINNYTAAITQMLDMFPENIARNRNKKFVEKKHRYYNLNNLKKESYHFEGKSEFKTNIEIHSGGIRNNLFGLNQCLTKHALILNDEKTKRGKFGHLLKKGKIADFSAVLYHYKFTDYFFDQIEDAVEKEQYHNNSEEYKVYNKILKNFEILDLKKEAVDTLKNTNELLENNFLVISDKYRDFMKLLKIKTKEDVSVIMGVKNRMDYRIENAFKSLRNQDYDQTLIKIILVDYGSMPELVDGYSKLCNEYNIRYIRIENVIDWNRAHALNIGIKRAETKYILCSDIDIIFEKNYISKCVKEMQKEPEQIIYVSSLDLSESDLNSEMDLKIYNQLKKIAIPSSQLQNMYYPYGLGINFTLKKYYFMVNGYDEYYKFWGCEDDDIIKRFSKLGLKIRNIFNKTSYLHQGHSRQENLTESQIDHIVINRDYLKNSNTLLRNENNWGSRYNFHDPFIRTNKVKSLKNKINNIKEILNYKKIKIDNDLGPITIEQAEFINSFLIENKLRRTLEIGFANGLSAYCIISATKSIHYVIDPYEKINYKENGIKNIMQLGLIDNLKLYEDYSYNVLPKLLNEKLKFDFAFIDGCHLFDYVFLDFYYIDKLLELNGYVMFHDFVMPSVKTVVNWIRTNKNNYSEIPTNLDNLILFKKIGQDKRIWDHFNNFLLPPAKTF